MTDLEFSPGHNKPLETLSDWLITSSLHETNIENIFTGASKRLRALGIPLDRHHLSYPTLHPQTTGTALIWTPEQELTRADYMYEEHSKLVDEFITSPFYHLLSNDIDHLRRALIGPGKMLDFPILHDLENDGYTDYVANKIEFDIPVGSHWPYRPGIIASVATKRENGFTNGDIIALRRIIQRLAIACKTAILREITQNLMQAYLGRDAGKSVLEGSIQRGDGYDTHAVIWYSDMRDSTHLAEILAPKEYLSLLNDYFEVTAGIVDKNGGDILTFIGDAVLAVFPISKKHPQKAYETAYRSAQQARKASIALSAENKRKKKQIVQFGLGLHIGDLVFGNIGIPSRMSFTVIGRAMNEAARLESMCKTLNHPVLVSGEFAKGLRNSDGVGYQLEDLGKHALKGISRPMEIYAAMF